MKRMDWLQVAVVSAVWMLAVSPVGAQPAKAARPNFILCMTDDQGWADVSYNEKGRLVNGKFKTVKLDKMAAAGLRFDRFYAAAPVCSPKVLDHWTASVRKSQTGADYPRK